MLGLGKDVSGMVGISWDGVGAGTSPDNVTDTGISGDTDVTLGCHTATSHVTGLHAYKCFVCLCCSSV